MLHLFHVSWFCTLQTEVLVIAKISQGESFQYFAPFADEREYEQQNLDYFVVVIEQLELKVVCSLGVDCTKVATTRISGHNDTREAQEISLELQEGDWLNFQPLQVNTEQDQNDSFQMRITNITTNNISDCMEVKSPQVIGEWSPNVSNNFTISFDILLPGTNYFSISLKSLKQQCELVWRVQVNVRSVECATTPTEGKMFRKRCMRSRFRKGINIFFINNFACQCCPGYIGRYCEEKDGCHSNPCNHGGFCVDITEGLVDTTFQCLCPHGYHGQSCDDVVNLCDRQPCLNNATCWGNQTSYNCECPSGFIGKNCEVNVNECLSNPCVHGVCEDAAGGYKCYCLPGYGGDHCEFEYDECDSSPCINGGACEDLVAGYKCHCGPGYNGRRCQVKVDLCQPNPCPSPAQCVDRGNNYSCICHPGYNGAGCTQRFDPCYPIPCENGGTCWPSLDLFFCSCLPGYTGDTCEDELLYPVKPLAHTQGKTEKPQESSMIDNVSVSLEHVHNIYIAASTLAGACLIAVIVVTLCHCRVHKSYQRFVRKFGRSRAETKQQKTDDPDKFSLNLQGNTSDFRPFSDSVYEATTIDLTDNLDRPLID
ncbi:delta-like protein D [Limulus polyphemus]|uniref:Delta-like protein D n=1 Tax=Limulus polyphemus TaxID=6850 RepID=A0ABM1SJN4_LIMPO|nr:delta-like protein D [Limulus polyphemus]